MGDVKLHSRLAPSGSKRWINCPGSIELSDKCPPQADSPYAIEGTAAHSLGEICITNGKDPRTYIGKVLEEGQPVVSENMTDAVQEYLDCIEAYQNELQTHPVIEQKLDMSWIHPDIGGTPDCTFYSAKHKKLVVIDYKHGQGVPVDVDNNTQLMIYALGAVHDLYVRRVVANIEKEIKLVELVIVQPRSFHPDGPVRKWAIDTANLQFWALNVLKPAAERTDKKDAVLAVGEHCKFCPALAVCPEQVKNALSLAKTEFEDPILPSPEDLTVEQIAKVLEVSKLFSEWAHEVERYAQGRMEIGQHIPGFKLVQKRSNRQWVDVDKAVGTLVKYLGTGGAYETKPITPAKAEKALKKKALNSELVLDGLIFKPEPGITLAPESDKRRGVEPPAAMAFLEDADFLQ